mmetsp:Transcript_47867/g.154330  ORF Transcript_47867/g.154330 Transcript_47867/m.154330 type:complete len:243 (-) Transcript_47867:4836-5564(-)
MPGKRTRKQSWHFSGATGDCCWGVWRPRASATAPPVARSASQSGWAGASTGSDPCLANGCRIRARQWRLCSWPLPAPSRPCARGGRPSSCCLGSPGARSGGRPPPHSRSSSPPWATPPPWRCPRRPPATPLVPAPAPAKAEVGWCQWTISWSSPRSCPRRRWRWGRRRCRPRSGRCSSRPPCVARRPAAARAWGRRERRGQEVREEMLARWRSPGECGGMLWTSSSPRGGAGPQHSRPARRS